MVRGTLPFKLECFPAFDYARARHELHLDEKGAVFESDGVRLGLSSPVKLRGTGASVEAELTLNAGDDLWFLLRQTEPDCTEPLIEADYDGTAVFHDTVNFWRQWVAGIKYRGRWRETVQRSALALKLLTFAPTGAIASAHRPPPYGDTPRHRCLRRTWPLCSSQTTFAFDVDDRRGRWGPLAWARPHVDDRDQKSSRGRTR